MKNTILEKGGSNQVSLNIKISSSLNSDLKALRKRAREQGVKFNVSALVESYLKEVVERASDELLELSMDARRGDDSQQMDAFPDELFGEFVSYRKR